MEIISEQRLKELLETEKLNVEILPTNADQEDSIEIGQMMDLVLSEENQDGPHVVYKGYTVGFFRGKQYIEKEFDNVGSLFDFLKKQNLFSNGEITVLNYNNSYPTYEEYIRARAFEKADMDELLNKYLPQANRFSLTCPYNEYSSTHRYGKFKLSAELGEKAVSSLKENTVGNLKDIYNSIRKEEEADLPPFEELLESIDSEVAAFRARNNRKIKKNGGHAFMCDRFTMEKTNFRSPAELWHFYDMVDFVYTCAWNVRKMSENKRERALDRELDDPYYASLKADLINIDVTFAWHCTTSSMLSKVYYFRLTEHSINWLKRLKDDYDMKDLQDLAFYKGDRLLFSSCTHEGFHNDLSEKALSE